MHRRLPTAGIEVAPHYHQLLVMIEPMFSCNCLSCPLANNFDISLCAMFPIRNYSLPLHLPINDLLLCSYFIWPYRRGGGRASFSLVIKLRSIYVPGIFIHTKDGLAGGLDGRRSPVRVTPKILAVFVAEERSQT